MFILITIAMDQFFLFFQSINAYKKIDNSIESVKFFRYYSKI